MTKVFFKKDELDNLYWYKEGTEILHREDGPAVESADGTKYWYQDDKLHRLDGPAIEDSNGNKYWYQNDKLHREDGPAVEYADGNKEYCLNGICYLEIKSDKEWIIFQIIN